MPRLVKYLHRTNTAITHAGGKYNEPRELFPILGGLLTLESDWSPAFGDAFTASLQALPVEGRLNIGCSLKNGSYSIAYDPAGKPTADIKDGDVVLLSFFLRLLAELQAFSCFAFKIARKRYIRYTPTTGVNSTARNTQPPTGGVVFLCEGRF